MFLNHHSWILAIGVSAVVQSLCFPPLPQKMHGGDSLPSLGKKRLKSLPDSALHLQLPKIIRQYSVLQVQIGAPCRLTTKNLKIFSATST